MLQDIAEGQQPSVAVIEDCDFPNCVGAFWGNNTTIHKGFGISALSQMVSYVILVICLWFSCHYRLRRAISRVCSCKRLARLYPFLGLQLNKVT